MTISSNCNHSNILLSTVVVHVMSAQGRLPDRLINNSLKIPNHVKLADPNYYEPQDVDLLIGASLFWHLLREGQISLGFNKPILQNTSLGWIISGSINSQENDHTIACNVVKVSDNFILQEQLAKFWELESVPNICVWSKEETLCEDHFKSTYKRDSSGQFIVRIPFKDCTTQHLGNSKNYALKMFQCLERRFNRNLNLKKKYDEFMQEYIQLGHMTLLTLLTSEPFTPNYYLPHHGIIRESSLTTKLRVVFNASAQTSSGKSLNDLQMVGPTIQSDLFSILIRFRQNLFVVSADIEKMYRQILVDDKDRQFQLVFWREDPKDNIKTYKLNTITYGTSSAPFLAIRCLHQLGLESQAIFPKASIAILQDFYVDDLLTGCDSDQELIQTSKDIYNILQSAKMPLRKWASNSSEIIQSISNSLLKNIEHQTVSDSSCNILKTLGLPWLHYQDQLCFKIDPTLIPNTLTKRDVLSYIAQLFDPLGLIAPVICKPKFLCEICGNLNYLGMNPYHMNYIFNGKNSTRICKY
ncbi:uncharacterized protein LOC116165130 [Photinus pyralis]|uniref:uncharacterized protein LOC116165130 n=1 Tax=Photinus pyralis TaxID=7054 RepID=UPI00126763E1|nr:uncharacterized protein LOC116165130 [Photinus pyralis]